MSDSPAAPSPANRLAREKSPYLLQHARNPVDWYPWGEEAFERARKEDKPIFLSIGYSTCHWCHVMERESFEDPATGAYLREHFISIKVDREERPDVDKIYLTFVQVTTGGGGWPLNVFLTPDLKPFYGGTYYPPEDRHGRPGFLTLLGAIARHWREDRAKVDQSAEEVTAALRRYAVEGGPREDKPPGAPRPLHEHTGE
ncbi:MAG: thioredoxin domain-containing protein, partial [Verrucomicrobiota bacterium]